MIRDIILGLFIGSILLNAALLSGFLARPAWVVPPDSMVVAKDFITTIQEKK
jgi:hypothetical protein